MKKTIIFSSITLVMMFAFASCGGGISNSTKVPQLKNQSDSLNYALGVANGDGIRQYYIQNDTTGKAVELFLKGLSEGLNAKEEVNGELSGLAAQIGSTLKKQEKDGLMNDSTLKVNYNLIRQGLINGLDDSNIQMSGEEAQTYLQTTMNLRMYKENKEAGEKFLAENANKEGVITTASGLQYKIITEGKGKVPVDTNVVEVHYHGTLIDGTVFDSSVDRGTPTTFPVTQVIAGWTEALKLMPVGSKWILYVPQELAYGATDKGTIKPFSTLIFEVQLISIK